MGLELSVTLRPPSYHLSDEHGTDADTRPLAPPTCRTELVLSLVDHGQFSPAIRFRGTKDMWRVGSLICAEAEAEVAAGSTPVRLVARVPHIPRGVKRAAVVLRVSWSAQSFAFFPAFEEPELRLICR